MNTTSEDMRVRTINLPGDPFCVAVSPVLPYALVSTDGGVAFVQSIGQYYVSTLNVSDKNIGALCCNPVSRMAYASDYINLYFIDIENKNVIRKLDNLYIRNMVVNSEGTKIFGITTHNSIIVISTDDGSVLHQSHDYELPLSAIGITQDGSKLYVCSSYLSQDLSAYAISIDTTTYKIINEIGDLTNDSSMIISSADSSRMFFASDAKKVNRLTNIDVIITSTDTTLKNVKEIEEVISGAASLSTSVTGCDYIYFTYPKIENKPKFKLIRMNSKTLLSQYYEVNDFALSIDVDKYENIYVTQPNSLVIIKWPS